VEKRFEHYVRLLATAFLVVGCFLVLRPFLPAILFAAVICAATWPLNLGLRRRLGGRQSLAALTMTLLLILVAVLPLAIVAYNLADNIGTYYDALRKAVEHGPPAPPAWLAGLPVVGKSIDEYWRHTTGSQEEMIALAKRLLDPAKNYLLSGGILLGQGVLQMSLSAFISFFFYRDGEALLRSIGVAMNWVAGPQSDNLLNIINNTLRSVMFGLLGTALAQGFVATIGFAIAGVPAVLMLGMATALLSLIPIGPPLIWGGAALWLFRQGETGWGVFMLFWGAFLISSVDNVVKPYLISRGGHLPFLLVLLGVMGGVLAFGFVGIFIGPTFLAVGLSLARNWTVRDQDSTSN